MFDRESVRVRARDDHFASDWGKWRVFALLFLFLVVGVWGGQLAMAHRSLLLDCFFAESSPK